MLVGLEKVTLVNFPGRVSCAVFLPGCNMRCGFCHNSELVLASSCLQKEEGKNQIHSNQYYSLEEVFSFLQKRRKMLSGVVISGGEPCASPYLYTIIEKVKEYGLALKIDTNGLFPEKLEELLSENKDCLRPQMIALDVKTSPDRYIELMPDTVHDEIAVANKIIKSLHILREEQAKNKDFLVDYRTVLVPNLVNEAEIRTMASFLPKTATWSFAEFIQGSCLNPSWNSIKPYSTEEITHLVELAKSFVKGAKLR